MPFANWIPPDGNPPPDFTTYPTKTTSKGMEHANEILGKFNNVLPMGPCTTSTGPCTTSPKVPSLLPDAAQVTNPPKKLLRHPPAKTSNADDTQGKHCNDTPLDHMPTADKLAVLSSDGPPVELPATTKEKSTLEWQTKSPASGQPSALMVEKSPLEWQTKAPALGQPSALMVEKSTLEWQTKSPASGQPSASMGEKSMLVPKLE